jgi:Tol biopolymer transport system component
MPRASFVFAVTAVVTAGLASSSALPSRVESPRSLIAFSAGTPGGVQDIYVVRPDGTGLRRLTHSLSKEFTPTWSSDGRWIAYRFQPGRDETGEIYVMRANGSGARNLTRNRAGDYAPAWSPDGRRIAFASGRGNAHGIPDIYVMNADGSGVRRLTRNFDIDEYPSWSPDGKRIVFSSTAGVSFAGESRVLWVMRSDGSHLRQLTHGPYDMRPAWSPDGKRIAYESSRGAPRSTPRTIWVMQANGSNARRVIRGIGEHPAWSANGRKIVYAAYPGGIGIVSASRSGAARLIVSRLGEVTFPAWRFTR